ncbi:MAG: hypothetical protein Q4G36_10475 [Paracoccus sp. (in: a-proteobacteria)]|nr:hypothetical protein [Paracoccus sp. (in: a-proteobacteria)]
MLDDFVTRAALRLQRLTLALWAKSAFAWARRAGSWLAHRSRCVSVERVAVRSAFARPYIASAQPFLTAKRFATDA